ncbi:MAG TPA: SAM-dependent chlorinase/fluorinase [Candidatus Hydrogenedentes bacterium]|nr:SAM-dependent chlorinase/fluorinase [Candidatus Hydrogenedentota bacterium]
MSDQEDIPPLITLITDFGTRDPYVAAMKGVIRTICPDCRIDDLSHEISPQQILEAALFIEQAVPFFPQGTIHVIVVDPGVGTARHPIAVAANGQYFICPDNGVLTLYLQPHPFDAAYMIDNPDVMLSTVSTTFHGRDIFAPAAAHLAAGIPLTSFGRRLEQLCTLNLPQATQPPDGAIHGEVIHVDRFGNCITNITRSMMPNPDTMTVCLPNGLFAKHAPAYQSIQEGRPGFLFGSSGRLEIALCEESAHMSLGIETGAHIVARPV